MDLIPIALTQAVGYITIVIKQQPALDIKSFTPFFFVKPSLKSIHTWYYEGMAYPIS